jgi:DNA helicase-2/ATP-dependent DNA helicase PcrA
MLTFHRAKGLEWPVVFVVGLEEGYAPISQAKSASALGEERRLVYVALSRAVDELHLSWARQRRFGSRSVSRQPSPYLGPLETERQMLMRKTEVDPAVVRAAFAEGRAMLSASAPASERPTG